jgi:hypothetical protein
MRIIIQTSQINENKISSFYEVYSKVALEFKKYMYINIYICKN